MRLIRILLTLLLGSTCSVAAADIVEVGRNVDRAIPGGEPAAARDREPDSSADRPRVGLVLSGGGARGIAHIGVLRVLERLQVPVDAIAGTSMGAVVGALYSCGYSADEIAAVLGNTDWLSLFRDKPDRRHKAYRRKEDDNAGLFPFELGIGRDGLTAKAGLVDGNRIDFVFRVLTLRQAWTDDFDRLPVPYRAVATDLITGKPVVLDRGDLTRAMRASMAVPAVFTPVEIDGRILIDGGISRNLPVDIAREMGVDRIIAVDVGTQPTTEIEDISAIGVLNQSFMLLQQLGIDEQIAGLTDRDLLIAPALGNYSSADFDHAAEAIRLGEAAAESLRGELQSFSVSETDYAALNERRRAGFSSEPPAIRLVEIEVHSGARRDPRVLRERMRSRSGELLDIATLADDMTRLDQSGEYDSVRFSLEGSADAARLIVEAQESARGSNRLRFGLVANSNLSGDSNFELLALHRRSEIGRWGAEWKTTVGLGRPTGIESEYFQPLGRGGSAFLEGRASAFREKTVQFLETGDRERIEERRRELEIDFGIQLRNYGELRFGVLRGRSDLIPDTATSLVATDRELGGAHFRFTLDQLDDVFFPTAGSSTTVDLFLSRENLGADDRFDRLEVRSYQAWTRGRNTFVGGAEFGTNLGSELPFVEQFPLGGFLNLSGFREGQLRGNVKALVTVVDYWKISSLGPLGKLYLGGAVQGGNVWNAVDQAEVGDLLYSGTLFFGVDTPLSPVFLGYGLADGGEHQLYLSIGRALGR